MGSGMLLSTEVWNHDRVGEILRRLAEHTRTLNERYRGGEDIEFSMRAIQEDLADLENLDAIVR